MYWRPLKWIFADQVERTRSAAHSSAGTRCLSPPRQSQSHQPFVSDLSSALNPSAPGWGHVCPTLLPVYVKKLVYVALSRCTHLGGLYLTNALGDHSFYHREDNPDRAMTDEFRRLENHRLQTVTGRYLDALRREEQRERRRLAFTLALLNVRSLRAHALDVARDPVLQEVDVLCLKKTWNNNKQEGGQEARGEGRGRRTRIRAGGSRARRGRA
ncbi:hypothetical protein HPB49_014730 [Dermacentor silvarum]|uniref:Uncharacterized protein n=1 Tax=Dermacentor silvarum TaxID=543639 RepID=A0ACB8CXX2_DERSI|nr:hypothetical protein HPB49_014730 [Dermacentor silvarum]